MQPLEIVDAQWLMQNPFGEPDWIIEGLVTVGLTLVVGSPKVGKSWFVLQLGNAVSMGQPLWGFPTTKCDVLYLCLEDSFARVQRRLWKVADEVTEGFRFANVSGKVRDDLIPQLEGHLAAYPETRLFIIDTLQKVRSSSGDNAYAADYDEVGLIKSFADRNNVAVLCVHHRRKMGDSDVFNTVSGSNGITGVADTTLVFDRANRSTGNASLVVAGRDVEGDEYRIKLVDCRWQLVGKLDKDEAEELEMPDDVLAVLDFMESRREPWQGRASELMIAAGVTDTSASAFGKHMAMGASFLLDRGIRYQRKHTRQGNMMSLEVVDSVKGEGCEACDG